MRKISWIIVCSVSLLLITVPMAVPSYQEYIRVDRYSYCIGDPITVYIFVPGTGEVTVWDHMTNGYTKVIFHQSQSCGQDYWYTLVGYAEGPPGTEMLEYEAYISCCYGDCMGSHVTDHVSFTIQDCGPCEEWLHVICNEGGYDLYVDGVYILTEDGDGESGVKLEEGTHTVQVKKDGCDTVTKTVQITCGHTTTLTVTLNCDPCKGVTCGTVCRGYDLWHQKCVDGNCVDDTLVEANSVTCGYDPCSGVVCNDICKGYDLWAQKCVNGNCVDDHLVESDSVTCGFDPCADHCNNGVQDCGEYGVDCGGGCPFLDSDADGVEDCEDLCPNSRCNQVDINGCETDADADGVLDCDDDCPSEKGDASNRGCPSNNFILLLGGLGGIAAVGGGLALWGLKGGAGGAGGGKPPTPKMIKKAPTDIAARKEAAEKIAEQMAREAAEKQAGAKVGEEAAGKAGEKVAEAATKKAGTKVAEAAAGAGLAGTVSKKQKKDIFCPNCGEKLPADSKFCGKCGHKLQ